MNFLLGTPNTTLPVVVVEEEKCHTLVPSSFIESSHGEKRANARRAATATTLTRIRLLHFHFLVQTAAYSIRYDMIRQDTTATTVT